MTGKDTIDNNRVCIICRAKKPILAFNIEHVFPDTIGGAFKIDLVCKNCNSHLGKRIDTPFVNHKSILIFRNRYGLKRGNRSIKNPFADEKIQTADGRKIIITQTEDNTFVADYPPHLEKTETANGPLWKLTMSENWVSAELLELYKQRFEKETGLKMVQHKIKKTEEAPVRIVTKEPDTKVIWACLKIAYESAVSCLPGYFDDPLAKVYSKMLCTNEFQLDFRQFFNPGNEVSTQIGMVLNKYAVLEHFHCYAVIMNLPGYGLVCMIKVFDIYYPIILSQKMDYLDARLLVLANNSEKKIFGCAILKSIQKFQFAFDIDSMTPAHFKELEGDANAQSAIFRNEMGLIAIYNKNGITLLSDIESLTITAFEEKNPTELAQRDSLFIGLAPDQYLKSARSKLLFKVLEIGFIY